MRLDIIGAGIGGLTLAIALKQKGFDIKLYEQSKEIKPIGAGIILANNAMQIYDKLGLRKEIEEKGHVISSMNITKTDLQPISEIDLKYFEDKYQVKNIAIHRGVLQKILVDKLNLVWEELQTRKPKNIAPSEKKKYAEAVFEVCKKHDVKSFTGLYFGLGDGKIESVEKYMFEYDDKVLYKML